MNLLWGRVIRLSLKASVPGFFLGLTAAVTPAADALGPVGDSAGGGGGCLEQIPGACAAPGTGLPRSPHRRSPADSADNEGTRSPSFNACSNSRQVGLVKPKPPPFGDKHHHAGTAAFRPRLKKYQSRPPGWCDTKKGKIQTTRPCPIAISSPLPKNWFRSLPGTASTDLLVSAERVRVVAQGKHPPFIWS